MVAARLTSHPGASDHFRGAIVTYATDLKASVLGIEGLDAYLETKYVSVGLRV